MQSSLPLYSRSGSNPNLQRYVVQSSDVLAEMRVNVSQENSDKVLWYKERFLSDDEIVEHVVDNETSTICWEVHRPKRGWYIRISAPSFPTGVFISILPVPPASPYHADAALSFGCRTNKLTPATTESSESSSRNANASQISIPHSYPPSSPPLHAVQPPSPKYHSKPHEASASGSRSPQDQVTNFILAPLGMQALSENSSFLSRAFSVLRSQRPTQSNSFALSPIHPLSPPPPYASSASLESDPKLLDKELMPLLTFHDQTPILTLRSITGLLEIDKARERMLGVQTSFWITVALTYLEFLEERDSYLAALSD